MGLGDKADFANGSGTRGSDQTIEWMVTFSIGDQEDAKRVGGSGSPQTSSVVVHTGDDAESFAQNLTEQWNSDHSARGYRASYVGRVVTFQPTVDKMEFRVEGGTTTQVSTGAYGPMVSGIDVQETA